MAPKPSGRFSRVQRLTILASILGATVVFLDSAVINVALPAIRSNLHATFASQQWVVNAYLVTLGSLLLIGGSLGDVLGRKRVFTAGLVGFALTSILCAVAPTDEFLIGARALQGIAGALLVPSSLAIIVASFRGPARGRAIGTWTAWTGIAFIIGPLVGGLLVETLSWRWVFLLNLPFIAVTLYLVKHLADSLDRRRPVPIDYLGAVLATLGLAGPVYGLIEQPTRGWSNPTVWVSIAGGVILFAAFLIHQYRTKYPMMPLGLFRRRNFAVGNASTLLVYGGLSSFTFLLVLFLQQIAGYSPLASGLALMPVTVILFLLSPRFGLLSARYGPRFFMGAGPIIAGGGLLLFLPMGPQAPFFAAVLPGILVFGLGLALTVAPLTTTVLSGVDENHAGLASGVNNAISRVAGLLAIAVVGALVAIQFGSAVDASLAVKSPNQQTVHFATDAKSRPLVAEVPNEPGVQKGIVKPVLVSSSTSAFHLGMLVSALLVIAGGVISALGIENPKPGRQPV